MPTILERREAYRKQKAEFAAQEAAQIDAIKTGVMERLRERFPGIKFAWATPEESPYKLTVYVRYEGKGYGAELPFTQLAIEGEHERAIHWFCEALAGHLLPRPSKTDYRQEANDLFNMIADDLERRFPRINVYRYANDPPNQLRIMIIGGASWEETFDVLQLENWQATGAAFIEKAVAKLRGFEFQRVT